MIINLKNFTEFKQKNLIHFVQFLKVKMAIVIKKK